METRKIFIGELSKETKVPIKTIRYYEELGLLLRPKRTDSAYRLYTQRDIDKLNFVKKAKELGLTLAEIKEILATSHQGLKPCCDFVKTVFLRKIREYEDKIKEITAVKHRLEEKLGAWITKEEAKEIEYTICPHIETDKPKASWGNSRKKKGANNAR